MKWRRLRAELRGAPSPDDADRAIAALGVRDQDLGGDALELAGAPRGGVVSPRGGEALDRSARRDVVVLDRGVYASVPLREARVRLLELAARIADRIVLHVPVIDEQSHLGRLALDAPRGLLRAAGLDAPEPGDRFGPDRYAHCFFDEEPLYAELRDAGLVVVGRRGFSFLLTPGTWPREAPAPFAVELGRALRLTRDAERARVELSPQRAIAAMRARGQSTGGERGPFGRARLRRAISWVDAALGASCYRRVLLELALDAGAARERVIFGLDVGSTGHAQFEHREDRTFDVVFALGAEEG